MSRPCSESGKPKLLVGRAEFVSSFRVALWSAIRWAFVSRLLVCREAIRLFFIRRWIPTEVTLLIEGGAEVGFLQRFCRGVGW